jgi:hypothetical protein
MRLRNVFILAFALVVGLPGVAALADYVYTDTGGNHTVFSFVCQTTKLCTGFVIMDSTGTEKATSGNPVRTDPTGTTTQPVSATSLPLPPNAATETGGNLAGLKSDFDSYTGAPGSTACASDTASCSQNQQLQRLLQRLSTIVTALGSPLQAGSVTVVQPTGTNLHIGCDSGCSSSTAPADESVFTWGTTSQTPIGGFFQTTATNNPLTNGQMGAWQFTAQRAGFVNLRNSSGTEIGTTSNPLQAGAPASSFADGWDVTEGAKADSACATDNGTCSVAALIKRTNQNLTTLNTTAGSPVPAGTNILGKTGIDQTSIGTTNGVALVAVNTATALAGAGAVGTGSARIAVGQDTTTIAGSAPGTAGTPSANVVTVQGAASMTPVQVNPTPYPATAVPITASATGTTTATTATLTNVTSHTTYICGFSIRANATGAATNNATVTGTITGTLNFTQWTAPLASGLGVTEEVFSPCIPASAVSTSIAIVSGAPGSGGVVSVTAWGYSL